MPQNMQVASVPSQQCQALRFKGQEGEAGEERVSLV